MQPKWFVFFSKAHAEKSAGEEIEKLGFDVLVPLEKRMARGPNRKPREYEVALFPRYGFVQFDPADHRWGAIKHADGVIDLIQNDGQPISVPDSQIEPLRLAMDMGMFDKTKPPEVGIEVEATDGPFTGLIGKIMRARTGDRVDVLFSILGAERQTTMSLGQLREA